MTKENMKKIKDAFNRLQTEGRNIGDTDLFIKWYRSAETSIDDDYWPGGEWSEWSKWADNGPDTAVLDEIWEAWSHFAE